MRTAILTTWEDVSSLEDQWNPLLKSSKSDTVFLSWEWIQAWREATESQLKPAVITVYDERENLVGIAPFYQYELKLLKALRFKGLRIMGDYATGSEYPDWFVRADHEGAALQAIAKQLRQAKNLWDLIWMPKIASWNGVYDRITQALDSAGLMYHARECSFSGMDLPGSFHEYESSFTSKRRKNLRRSRRNLLAHEGIKFVFCESHEELPKFLDALFDLHNQRRLLLGDPGCFIRKPAEATFYRKFLPRALEKGWLRFAAITENETIQAIQVGYAYNDNQLQMQEGFNPDFIEGAGNVLRHMLIERCIEEGIAYYDFLGDHTEHKRLWKAKERLGQELLIARPSLKTSLLFSREIWPTGRYLQEHGLYDGNS